MANSTAGGLFSSTRPAARCSQCRFDGLDGQRLGEFTALCGPAVPRLIFTERLALGLDASTPMALSLSAGDDAQQGGGLGLANKMRRYQLQDHGLDTFEASTTLGFDDDERDYGMPARMLGMLNCTRIVLLTNNPAKLDGLTCAGIEIAGRMPLEAPIKPDHRRYMIAKAVRSGHRFDRLTALLANPS